MERMQVFQQGKNKEPSVINTNKYDKILIDKICNEINELPRVEDINPFQFAETHKEIFKNTLFPVIENSYAGFLNNGFLLIKGLFSSYSRNVITDAKLAEIFLCMFGRLFGEAYGYAGQRGGKLIQDLRPIKEHALQQLGTGSEVDLQWHTEDAHTFYSADVIGLSCVVGDKNANTYVSNVDLGRLETSTFNTLSRPYFRIYADNSHKIHGHQHDPVPVIQHCGDFTKVRFDPAYTHCLTDKAKKALTVLTSIINSGYSVFSLEKGDLLFINNRGAVHARSAFNPRYDKNDRWLKRSAFMNIEIPDEYLVPEFSNVIKEET